MTKSGKSPNVGDNYGKSLGAAWAPSDVEGYSLGANGQSAIRKVPTAYGDGLWGLQNTDITDAHGSIITDLLFFF